MEECCGNCKHWTFEEERRINRRIGICALSNSCLCCHPEILFGSVGGNGFRSDATFLCKFYVTKSETENANQSHS